MRQPNAHMSLATKGKKREREKTHWTVFNSICSCYINRLYGRAIYVTQTHIHTHTIQTHTQCTHMLGDQAQ